VQISGVQKARILCVCGFVQWSVKDPGSLVMAGQHAGKRTEVADMKSDMTQAELLQVCLNLVLYSTVNEIICPCEICEKVPCPPSSFSFFFFSFLFTEHNYCVAEVSCVSMEDKFMPPC